MEADNSLSGYVEMNEDRLERIALYGNDVASAMALTILERGNSTGELS